MAPLNSAWIEVSASALRHNVSVFRRLLSASGSAARLGVVLKGNAYGHGFAETLPLLHGLVDVIYVIAPEDALAVRAYERVCASLGEAVPRLDVLVIGAIEPEEAVALAREDVMMTVGDDSWVRNVAALRAAGLSAKARVHVHVDTGLSREGYAPEDLARGFAFLPDAARDALEVVGVFSHFANTEDVTEQAYALFQLENFHRGVRALRSLLGLSPNAPLEEHLAASAASLVLPAARLSCLRVGVAAYGLWPSSETRLSARLTLPELPVLEPALSLKCRSQIVKRLPAGTFVGYGCTWRCDVDARVAVLPVGYFDGLPRLVASKAHVLVRGHRAPVVGRVMMNHIVVDVTRATTDDAPLTATLIGTDGNEGVSIDTVAAWAQTINYEIVTRLGPHLRRVVTE